MFNVSKKIHPKLQKVLVDMYTSSTNVINGDKVNLDFYREFLAFINIAESKAVPTLAVTARSYNIYLLYNYKFVDELSDQQVLYCLLHEVMHLLAKHIERTVYRDPQLSNIAADMIINTCFLNNSIFKDDDLNKAAPPGMLTLPNDYEGERIYEILYDWILEKFSKYEQKDNKQNQNQQNQSGSGQSQGGNGSQENKQGNESGSDGQSEKESENEGGQQDGQGDGQQDESLEDDEMKKSKDPGIEKDKKDFKGMDNNQQHSSKEWYDRMKNRDKNRQGFDYHGKLTEKQKEQLKSRVGEIYNGLKNRGLVPAGIEEFLNNIKKSKKNFLKKVKKGVEGLFGDKKTETWTRPNRRVQGIKGYKKIGNAVNVILDTSGSMYGTFEFVLAFINKNEIDINLIQCDAAVHSHTLVHSKKDLAKTKLTGFGGTELNPAINYIKEDKKLRKMNTVILTDGWTDSLELAGLKKVLIITTQDECPITSRPLSLEQVHVTENDII